MAKNKLFKKGSLSRKVGLLTLVFVIILLSFLTPFMTIEGTNKTIGIIISIVIGVIYIFLLLLAIWDHINREEE